MTPDEFKRRMLEIYISFCPDPEDDELEERRNEAMQELMCSVLTGLGYGEGVKIFLGIGDQDESVKGDNCSDAECGFCEEIVIKLHMSGAQKTLHMVDKNCTIRQVFEMANIDCSDGFTYIDGTQLAPDVLHCAGEDIVMSEGTRSRIGLDTTLHHWHAGKICYLIQWGGKDDRRW